MTDLEEEFQKIAKKYLVSTSRYYIRESKSMTVYKAQGWQNKALEKRRVRFDVSLIFFPEGKRTELSWHTSGCYPHIIKDPDVNEIKRAFFLVQAKPAPEKS